MDIGNGLVTMSWILRLTFLGSLAFLLQGSYQSTGCHQWVFNNKGQILNPNWLHKQALDTRVTVAPGSACASVERERRMLRLSLSALANLRCWPSLLYGK